METFPTITITRHTSEREAIELAADCRMCGKCCQFGSGFLSPRDFPRLAKHLGVSQEVLMRDYLEKRNIFNTEVFRPRLIRKKGKQYGICIFYRNREGCIVHGVKPLHCKVTSPCSRYGKELDQWFLLNHVVNAADPESIRQWATYLRFNKAIPGGELKDLVRDQAKLKRILGYEILK